MTPKRAPIPPPKTGGGWNELFRAPHTEAHTRSEPRTPKHTHAQSPAHRHIGLCRVDEGGVDALTHEPYVVLVAEAERGASFVLRVVDRVAAAQPAHLREDRGSGMICEERG